MKKIYIMKILTIIVLLLFFTTVISYAKIDSNTKLLYLIEDWNNASGQEKDSYLKQYLDMQELKTIEEMEEMILDARKALKVDNSVNADDKNKISTFYDAVQNYGNNNLPHKKVDSYDLYKIVNQYSSAKSNADKEKIIQDFLERNGIKTQEEKKKLVEQYRKNLSSVNVSSYGTYGSELLSFLSGLDNYNGNLQSSETSTKNEINNNQNNVQSDNGEINIDFGKLNDIYGQQDGTYADIGGKILGIVSYLCYGAAVIVLVYKGVQFMNKAPEAKAELKKELVNAAIGAFILFAAGALVQTIGNIAMGTLFS